VSNVTARPEQTEASGFTPGALIVLLLAMAATAFALLQLQRADAGVSATEAMVGSTPLTVFRGTDPARTRAPDAATPPGAPVVVISHGFAGSQQLMESFAITLAKNGFIAVTFDYYGHGRHREPLRGDVTSVEGATQTLLEQTAEVVEFALALPDANGDLALLGHSMASDIIVRYAQRDPRVDATIAVSMFSPAVTPDSPQNLLVIVGGLEGMLKKEALRVLSLVTDDPQPGVSVSNPKTGDLRRVAFAEGVEHVGVLYSHKSMVESLNWLSNLYDLDSSREIPQRGPWIALLLAGLLTLAWPLSRALPVVSTTPRGASLAWRRLLPAALVPAIATPLMLFWFPADFLGVLVGGYLAVHFALYGLLSMLCLWWLRRGEPERPSTTHPVRLGIAALLATLYTAGVIGFALDSYVTSFAIAPMRWPLFVVMLAGTLSYFLCDEWLTHGTSTPGGGHLFTRFCFLLSLGIAVALSFEDLMFLLIIAGVIVIYFLVYGMFSRWIYQRTGHPAVGAIANAIAFAIALTAVFPVMSG
jgi:dienelactone hydrolase